MKLHQLDPDLLQKTNKAMCHGAAPGRTGWTDELLRPLLASEKTRREITGIIEMIINNEVDPDIRERINAARLIAIPKPPKNPGDKPGTRPITVNETFRKLAQAIAVKSVSASAAKHFEGLQYGIAVEGGAEILCHRISEGIRTRKILVALDATNAFNSPWRREIAKELKRNPQFHSLINQWNFCYSQHTELHFRSNGIEKRILSQRGTRQGDVLGAFLFALVIHPALVEAKKKFGDKIDIMAYLDDITLLGDDPIAMEACIRMIYQRFKELGISLNHSKCEWFSETHGCPFGTWKQVQHDPIKILGAFHAPSGKRWDDRMKELIKHHTVTKHSIFFERMSRLPSNIGLVLLSACGIPRMNYTVRVQKPEHVRDACEWFDKKVVKQMEEMGCIDLHKDARDLMCLPTAVGGMGLTRMSDISPLAYAASKSLLGPKNALKSQDELVAAHHVDTARRLQDSSPQMKLHMEDCRGEGNSKWLRSVEGVDLMSDDVTAAAIRTRLNVPHKGHGDQESLTCPGCQRSLLINEANQHISGCARIKGRNAAMRHAQFKNGTGRICTANGIHHQHKEPQGYEMRVCTLCRAIFPESKSERHTAQCEGCSAGHIKEAASVRPDKWIELKDEKSSALIEVVIDVSIVAGTTATNINDAASIADALKERERRKHALYGEAAKDRGEKLLVVAITPNGTMSDDAKLFAKLVAKTSDSRGAYTYQHATRDLKREVLKANASSLINGEKAMKAYFSPGAARDAEELIAAHRGQVALAEPALWYELPDDLPDEAPVEMDPSLTREKSVTDAECNEDRQSVTDEISEYHDPDAELHAPQRSLRESDCVRNSLHSTPQFSATPPLEFQNPKPNTHTLYPVEAPPATRTSSHPTCVRPLPLLPSPVELGRASSTTDFQKTPHASVIGGGFVFGPTKK